MANILDIISDPNVAQGLGNAQFLSSRPGVTSETAILAILPLLANAILGREATPAEISQMFPQAELLRREVTGGQFISAPTPGQIVPELTAAEQALIKQFSGTDISQTPFTQLAQTARDRFIGQPSAISTSGVVSQGKPAPGQVAPVDDQKGVQQAIVQQGGTQATPVVSGGQATPVVSGGQATPEFASAQPSFKTQLPNLLSLIEGKGDSLTRLAGTTGSQAGDVLGNLISGNIEQITNPIAFENFKQSQLANFDAQSERQKNQLINNLNLTGALRSSEGARQLQDFQERVNRGRADISTKLDFEQLKRAQDYQNQVQARQLQALGLGVGATDADIKNALSAGATDISAQLSQAQIENARRLGLDKLGLSAEQMRGALDLAEQQMLGSQALQFGQAEENTITNEINRILGLGQLERTQQQQINLQNDPLTQFRQGLSDFFNVFGGGQSLLPNVIGSATQTNIASTQAQTQKELQDIQNQSNIAGGVFNLATAPQGSFANTFMSQLFSGLGDMFNTQQGTTAPLEQTGPVLRDPNQPTLLDLPT